MEKIFMAPMEVRVDLMGAAIWELSSCETEKKTERSMVKGWGAHEIGETRRNGKNKVKLFL
jgi:hypothetical protein